MKISLKTNKKKKAKKFRKKWESKKFRKIKKRDKI